MEHLRLYKTSLFNLGILYLMPLFLSAQPAKDISIQKDVLFTDIQAALT